MAVANAGEEKWGLREIWAGEPKQKKWGLRENGRESKSGGCVRLRVCVRLGEALSRLAAVQPRRPYGLRLQCDQHGALE